MDEGVPCPAPAAKLPPPVRKSQDMQDERSKLVNEYACRVLELLGMGHRLFVPRLLAVSLVSLRFIWRGAATLGERPSGPRKRLAVSYFLRLLPTGHPGPRPSLDVTAPYLAPRGVLCSESPGTASGHVSGISRRRAGQRGAVITQNAQVLDISVLWLVSLKG